jgi:hypothetical protein
MSRLLIVGSGAVALYYGALFSRHDHLVDHIIISDREKHDPTSRVSVVSELSDSEYVYEPSFVPTFEPLNYQNIIVACESKRANHLCSSLQANAPPIIVLTSCWNTYRQVDNNASSVIWGFPRVVCESTKSCLKAVSLGTILIDAQDVYLTPQKISPFTTLFASVKVKLQPVNLKYVYPYLFLLTTCMYAQLLNERKVSLEHHSISSDRKVMEGCYADAYILLTKEMRIPVSQAELQTRLQWNPNLLINIARSLRQESQSSLSITGWIVNQLMNHKRFKMEYFIRTILADSNTKHLRRLRLVLLTALSDTRG